MSKNDGQEGAGADDLRLAQNGTGLTTVLRGTPNRVGQKAEQTGKYSESYPTMPSSTLRLVLNGRQLHVSSQCRGRGV